MSPTRFALRVEDCHHDQIDPAALAQPLRLISGLIPTAYPTPAAAHDAYDRMRCAVAALCAAEAQRRGNDGWAFRLVVELVPAGTSRLPSWGFMP